MFLDKISIGKNAPHEVNVIVENPVGGVPVKYEIDKESGAVFVDRFLHVAMQYPGNYGFIPHTLSDDGDPVDVLIIGAIPVVPGSVVAVRPVGVMKMEDEAGGDEKIIAVPTTKLDPEFTDIQNYTDIPESKRKRIEHFFERYKELEPGKWVKVHGWGDADEAKKMIEEGITRLKAKSAAA